MYAVLIPQEFFIISKYIRKEKCFMKNTGMSEEDISEIHSLTMKQFNEDNKYQRTTVSLLYPNEDISTAGGSGS